MKKYLLSFLLLTMFMPIAANAEETTCEKIATGYEKTVEIKIKQEIINKDKVPQKDMENAKFTYKILDLNNNVITETTNDNDGNIIFNCFTVKNSDVGSYKLYKIVMEENKNIPFEYDSNIIYFSLRYNYTNGLYDPIVAYYKDDGDDSPKRYNSTYKGKIFHATEEELQGQAYAVIDKPTGVMTFFRDEPGKYTNRQEDGNKIYYTGFEEHQNKSCFSSWSNGWRYQYDIRPYIKKIVFKDAVKPNNITGWFEELTELEELDIAKLDTSQLTGIDYFLYNCPKVKSVDISTFDTTNVNSLFKSFNNTSIEYLNFTTWNLNQSLTRVQLSELGMSNKNLKYLNISNFGDWSSSAEFGSLPCLEKLVINGIYDFYRTNIDQTDSSTWYNPKKNKAYNPREMVYILHNHSENMEGYYIRPICTTESSFSIKYRYSENNTNNNKNSSKSKTFITNPKTGISTIILLITIISIIRGTYFYKLNKKRT